MSNFITGFRVYYIEDRSDVVLLLCGGIKSDQKEEKRILKVFEKGEMIDIKNMRQEIERHQKYEKDFLRKNKTISSDGFMYLK